MTDKPIVQASDVKIKYQQALDTYKSFVWSTQSYPEGFPTSYLADPVYSSPQISISTPNSNDIISAVNTISNVIKNAAKSFTAIRLCRYVRLLQGDGGATTVMIDTTQRALFNAQYLVNFTDVETDTGSIIYDTKVDNFLNSITNQVNTTQNSTVYIETSYCHCLYENSLINIKYCENGVLLKDILNITLNDLKNVLSKEVYVETFEGYCKILNYFENGEKEIYELTLNDNLKLYCTLDHKIFYNEEYCKSLKEYNVNDEIFTKYGKRKIINLAYIGVAKTIDIEVENKYHNFYANDILVSNSSCHSSCHSCLDINKSLIDITYIDNDCEKIETKSLKEVKELLEKYEVYVYAPSQYYKILNYFEKGVNDVYEVHLENNLKLYCTLDHKIFYSENESKPLKDYKIGEFIKSNKGLSKIKNILFDSKSEIADIEVNNKDHNFYCNGLLVSNSRSRR